MAHLLIIFFLFIPMVADAGCGASSCKTLPHDWHDETSKLTNLPDRPKETRTTSTSITAFRAPNYTIHPSGLPAHPETPLSYNVSISSSPCKLSDLTESPPNSPRAPGFSGRASSTETIKFTPPPANRTGRNRINSSDESAFSAYPDRSQSVGSGSEYDVRGLPTDHMAGANFSGLEPKEAGALDTLGYFSG